MSDAIDELARALVAQERAEERLAKAAHALAEAEERAEDDPDAAAEVERCREFHEAAEAAVGFARGRRRELEARLAPAHGGHGHRLVDTWRVAPIAMAIPLTLMALIAVFERILPWNPDWNRSRGDVKADLLSILTVPFILETLFKVGGPVAVVWSVML